MKTDIYIFIICKKKNRLILRYFLSNLQYCISSKSVCMKKPMRVQSKKTKGSPSKALVALEVFSVENKS